MWHDPTMSEAPAPPEQLSDDRAYVWDVSRKLLYAGFRPQIAQVWVDGQFRGQYDGTAWIDS